MPRKTAGRKYPHVTTDAKPHNHQFCPVVAAIVRNVMNGAEEWGVQHSMPPVIDETTAKDAKRGFYASRYCREVKAILGEPVSIQSDYEPYGDAWVNWVRVWPRSVAKREIARRVQNGEKLAYNVVRKEPAA